MKKSFGNLLLAMVLGLGTVVAPLHALAQSEASIALSAMPIASVAVAGSATAGAVAFTSIAAGTLAVVAVEASVDGTTYLLHRASDGARFSVKLASGAVAGAWVVAGSVVTASVIGTGVVLSAAGEVLAFIPNALGRALLYNEKLS